MLVQRFRKKSKGTLQEQWLAHHQNGTVEEYCRRFIELLAPIKGVPEEITTGQYINGLKEEIRAEVRILAPSTLELAMDLSMRIEEKLNLSPKHKSPAHQPIWRQPNTNLRPNPNTIPTITTSLTTNHLNPPTPTTYPNRNANTNHKTTGEIRRLTERELQQKRERGLCFRCDEKWSVNHRCRRRELSVLLTMEGDGWDDSDERAAAETGDDK